jgi:imidazole glycerol-phosphate synthase subunit HisH
VGLGNLKSVRQALSTVSPGGVEVVVTRDADALASADKVVVPGQGAFGDAVRGLAGGLGDALRTQLARGAPYLGICLGLQLLFEESEETPGAKGLAVFAGRVRRLRGGVDAATGERLKVPHAGWNLVEPAAAGDRLLGTRARHFFFAHSYVADPAEPAVVVATTEYGERFASAVARGNVFACQFHPEKSQAAGLALLERFVRG